jgi:hypothetical protein
VRTKRRSVACCGTVLRSSGEKIARVLWFDSAALSASSFIVVPKRNIVVSSGEPSCECRTTSSSLATLAIGPSSSFSRHVLLRSMVRACRLHRPVNERELLPDKARALCAAPRGDSAAALRGDSAAVSPTSKSALSPASPASSLAFTMSSGMTARIARSSGRLVGAQRRPRHTQTGTSTQSAKNAAAAMIASPCSNDSASPLAATLSDTDSVGGRASVAGARSTAVCDVGNGGGKTHVPDSATSELFDASTSMLAARPIGSSELAPANGAHERDASLVVQSVPLARVSITSVPSSSATYICTPDGHAATSPILPGSVRRRSKRRFGSSRGHVE